MKRLLTLVLAILAISLCTSAIGQSFDEKLKRFVSIIGTTCIPEISCDEAVKLGFTVNDYRHFIRYVDQLNIKTEPALSRPENLFLISFIEMKSGKQILNIPLAKAIRAGATVEGYYQTLEVLDFSNKNLPADMLDELRNKIEKVQQELLDFAKQNPDSSAVKKFFTAPPMPEF